MKCVFCGNELTHSNETVERRIKSKIYYIKNVPADLCKFCGEVYIDDETVASINKTLENKINNEFNTTEVVDFSELIKITNSHSLVPNIKFAIL